MKNARDLLRLNVKRLREALGMNQPDLAAEAKLSPQMIQKIEQGRTGPSPETLDKLVAGLRTRHAELFFDETAAAALPAKTVGEMAISEFREEINRASRAAEKQPKSASLQTVWASWRGAPPEVKALCLYVLDSQRAGYLALLTEEQRKKVLNAARALGLSVPKDIA